MGAQAPIDQTHWTPKTKRLVDGRAGAHRPNALEERTNKFCTGAGSLHISIDEYKMPIAIYSCVRAYHSDKPPTSFLAQPDVAEGGNLE